MHYVLLDEKEKNDILSGAGITLAGVLAVLATAVIAVIVYKMFLSKKGNATVGGWKFSWN